MLLGFVIPVVMLGVMAYGSGQSLMSARYLGFMQNSVTVAAVASVLTVMGAVLIGIQGAY